MTEEKQSSPLDVSDLDNMLRAVKHAHTKNAYTMEEVAQLFPVVQRVEAWLLAYQEQLQPQKPKAPPTQLVTEGARPEKIETKKKTKK